jgi:hypothetical protein
MLGAAAATGGGTGCAGCPGWLGFVLMGLLSSGRGFHISAPFLSVMLSSEKLTILARDSEMPVAD